MENAAWRLALGAVRNKVRKLHWRTFCERETFEGGGTESHFLFPKHVTEAIVAMKKIHSLPRGDQTADSTLPPTEILSCRGCRGLN